MKSAKTKNDHLPASNSTSSFHYINKTVLISQLVVNFLKLYISLANHVAKIDEINMKLARNLTTNRNFPLNSAWKKFGVFLSDLDKFALSPNAHLKACMIPKNGHTVQAAILCELFLEKLDFTDENGRPFENDFHQMKKQHCISRSLKYPEETDGNFTEKLAVVRHPVDRFVSAWLHSCGFSTYNLQFEPKLVYRVFPVYSPPGGGLYSVTQIVGGGLYSVTQIVKNLRLQSYVVY